MLGEITNSNVGSGSVATSIGPSDAPKRHVLEAASQLREMYPLPAGIPPSGGPVVQALEGMRYLLERMRRALDTPNLTDAQKEQLQAQMAEILRHGNNLLEGARVVGFLTQGHSNFSTYSNAKELNNGTGLSFQGYNGSSSAIDGSASSDDLLRTLREVQSNRNQVNERIIETSTNGGQVTVVPTIPTSTVMRERTLPDDWNTA